MANKSDKDLSFQRQLKLMRWSTGKEVEPVSDTIVFDGTEFEAHTNGVMTVDLSKAYDMDFLEQPLADDNYYFVLTNNNFMFGQDWMCFVTFAEPIKTVVDDPIPVTPVEADKELVAQIMEELQPYFENYYTDIADRRNHADNYLVKCQELLATLDRDIVASEAFVRFLHFFLCTSCHETQKRSRVLLSEYWIAACGSLECLCPWRTMYYRISCI